MKNNKRNPNEFDQTGEVISWVVIFVLMFAVPPLGILLLILKLRGYNRSAASTSRYKSTQPSSSMRQASPQPQKMQSKNKKNRNPLEKKSGKFIATILLLISLAMLILGVSWVASAAQDMLANDVTNWYSLIMGIFFILGGATTFFSRNIGVRRFERYKKYYAFIAGRNIVPISDIALSAGQSVRTVKRDIQVMINSGFLEDGAYIDSELGSLIQCSQEGETARKAARATYEAPLQTEEVPENQYMTIISELRRLSATIVDFTISGKVDKLEELTAKIFRIIEENPEKQPQIRRFMSYYLPTTLKLLRSYATLEKQGIKGENIMAAKQNIGRILDTLATGYEQQLDQLFKSDAMDIAADINVLENLMQQDGLAGDKLGFKTMEGV